MSSSSPLPSLFGRFTSILRDHAHLGKTMRQLHVMCASLEGAQPLPGELSPRALLADLRRDLSAHFGAEEAAEYFGTVVEEAPELAEPIARLKYEHSLMLEAVEVLVSVAAQPPRWRELAAPTRELVAQLERHERAESTLLRRLFSAGA
jgi:hypothetical protein